MSAKEVLMAAAGGTADVTYVDDVFSTYLYTGNGSTQTITNGIDLSTNGGLVWIKNRSQIVGHYLFDTARGPRSDLSTNSTAAQETGGGATEELYSFNSSGFSVGATYNANVNVASNTYVSWTFRKAPKFFDVVTYTGTGANRTVAHSLGQVPGMIVVKRTDTTGNWEVYHRSLANTEYAVLNTTAAKATDATMWNSTTATASVFSLGTNTNVNASGGTYVAYLFAHDTATDGIIQCGSFTTSGSGEATINLGWEPQFVIIKRTDGAGSWSLVDVMRGWVDTSGSNDAVLLAESSGAEFTNSRGFPTATGFRFTSTDSGIGASASFIYLAIRRPNKPPTTGTQVFSPNAVNVATGTAITTNFPIDLQIFSLRTGTTNKNNVYDRLRGISSNTTESGVRLITSSTAAETAAGNETLGWDNTGFKMTSVFSGASDIFWNFRRAPGFFDEVCYTGTGSARTVNHNLGVAPELMITKKRSEGTNSSFWWVYHKDFIQPYYALLNSNAAGTATGTALYASVGATTYTAQQEISQSSQTYVAYLFATCPGISKVFSYTGNGTSQTINCGFTTGARFVLIKRTDVAGDWYVWDSARGIVAGNDPHLSLNTTAVEVTTDDSVDTDTTGFIVNQLAATNVNVTSATYIGLAIA